MGVFSSNYIGSAIIFIHDLFFSVLFRVIWQSDIFVLTETKKHLETTVYSLIYYNTGL